MTPIKTFTQYIKRKTRISRMKVRRAVHPSKKIPYRRRKAKEKQVKQGGHGETGRTPIQQSLSRRTPEETGGSC